LVPIAKNAKNNIIESMCTTAISESVINILPAFDQLFSNIHGTYSSATDNVTDGDAGQNAVAAVVDKEPFVLSTANIDCK